MLTGLQGDVIRIMDPETLENIIAGTTAVPMTQEILAAMGAMMLIPIFMVFLSLELPYKTNRWANIIVAVVFIMIDGIGFVIPRPAYENIMGIGYVVFCVLIVFYAWKWKNSDD